MIGQKEKPEDVMRKKKLVESKTSTYRPRT